LEELDRYRWSGHGVLVGEVKGDWQERQYGRTGRDVVEN